MWQIPDAPDNRPGREGSGLVLERSATGTHMTKAQSELHAPMRGTRSRMSALALSFAVVAAVSACGSGEAESDATASSEPSTAAPTTPLQSPSEAPAPPTSTAPPAPTTPAEPAVNFTMPDFVGMDLQSAQDLVQTNGVWLSVSHDLLGSRNQAIDSNWVVCDQNIPAGQQVTGDVEGTIDFGVVKRGEVPVGRRPRSSARGTHPAGYV